MRWIWLAAVVIPLSGCAIPPAITIASLVLDTTSYAVSGKTVTDHGLSAVMGQDCSVIGILDGKICQDDVTFETATATLQPLLEPEAEPQPETASLPGLLSGDSRNETAETDSQLAVTPPDVLGFAGYLSDGVQPSQWVDS